MAKIAKKDYQGVKDEQIQALLQKHAQQISKLPDFKSPQSRSDAVDLLVAAGIDPEEDAPPRKGKKSQPTYRVKHPTIVNGHFHGVIIRDGFGETEDASVAANCATLGCTVEER